MGGEEERAVQVSGEGRAGGDAGRRRGDIPDAPGRLLGPVNVPRHTEVETANVITSGNR